MLAWRYIQYFKKRNLRKEFSSNVIWIRDVNHLLNQHLNSQTRSDLADSLKNNCLSCLKYRGKICMFFLICTDYQTSGSCFLMPNVFFCDCSVIVLDEFFAQMTELEMVVSLIYFGSMRAYIYVENQTVIHLNNNELWKSTSARLADTFTILPRETQTAE